MAAIKKFFEKRKLSSKFKSAGPGHALTESQARAAASSAATAPIERAHPSQSAQMAGVAAIQRIEQQQRRAPSMANRSLNVIRAEAKRELELERIKKEGSHNQEVVLETPTAPSVNGAFFTCSLVGAESLPKAEMEAKIKEFLYQQLEEERGLTACLIIHTCNKNKEKVQGCIETLCKMLRNIAEHPDEEKFRRIRVGTKAFQEKILPVEGATHFLQASGFECQTMEQGGEAEEKVYVYSKDKDNTENLVMLMEALRGCEPIRPELDRSVRVFYPAKMLERIEIPHDFYNMSVEDIKREQQLKSEEVEKNLMLRTKAMREKDSAREIKKYRFCLIRIRFPDGILLQGTFKTWEKVSALREFVWQHLAYEGLPFALSTSIGERLTEDDATLAELGLVPATVINFAWESGITSDGLDPEVYLKDETLALCSRT